MNNIELLKNITNKEDKMLCSTILDKYKIFLKTGKTTYSQFVDNRELTIVLSILNKVYKNYIVYKPHEYCEKSIIVFGNTDNVNIGCIKVYCSHKLEHKDYLGTLFSLGINRHYFGDILIDRNNAYIFLDNNLIDFVKYNMLEIKNYKVDIEEVSINDVHIETKRFEELTISVPSNRIDVVISKLINKSREDVKKLINKNKVLLNYNYLDKGSVILKDNDVFSINKYGKYIYRGIEKTTKKKNIIIKIDKYI